MKNSIFKNESKGIVELYLTASEVVVLLEILGFTRKLCDSFLSNKEYDLSQDKVDMLTSKSLDAKLLEERIRLDADPGRPEGPLN